MLTIAFLAVASGGTVAAEDGAAKDGAVEDGQPAVALVYWMSGDAVVELAASVKEVPIRQPLRILDRLDLGSTIHTQTGAEVMLAYFDGQRFVLGSESRAVVASRGLKVKIGSGRRLEPVPSLALIPRLASSENPGRHPGTVRIRTASASWSSGFWMSDDAVLPDRAVLRFRSAAEDTGYRVEILHESGELLHAISIRGAPVRASPRDAIEIEIPERVLRPGDLHFWQVSTGDGEPLGNTLFAVLSHEDAQRYRSSAGRLAGSDDPGARMLLFEVERRLGLRHRACNTLSSVSAKTPGEGASARSELRRLRMELDCAQGREDRHEMALAVH